MKELNRFRQYLTEGVIKEEVDVLIASSDKDMLQLVDNYVKILSINFKKYISLIIL